MMFVDVLTGLPHVKAGALKALAVTTKQRSALLPQLPSMDEAGVKGFDITSWQGYLGPANLPKDIPSKSRRERIIDEVMKASVWPNGLTDVQLRATAGEWLDAIETAVKVVDGDA